MNISFKRIKQGIKYLKGIPFPRKVAIIAFSVGLSSMIYGNYINDGSWINFAVFSFIIGTVALFQKEDSVRVSWNDENGTFLVSRKKRTLEFEVSEIKSFESLQGVTPSKYQYDDNSPEHVAIEIEFHKKTPFGKKIQATIYHGNQSDYEGYKKLKYAYMKLRSDRAKRIARKK